MAAVANKIKQLQAYREIASDRLQEIYEIATRAEGDVNFHTSLEIRYRNLDRIYEDFNSHHKTLLQHLVTQEDADMAAEKAIRKLADDQYFSIRTIFHDLFNKQPSDDNTPVAKQCNAKLPKLNIPTFTGNLKDWHTFNDLYKSLIHTNDSLTSSEKFQYLLSLLSGEALTLIKNLPLSSENYDIAYNNLTSRFQNKRLLANFYWEAINNAPKVSSESPRALRNLLDVFSDNLAALKNLKFPVEQWDFILFNMFSKKLDSETLKRFELQHGSSDLPTYEDLRKFVNKQCIAFDSIALVKPCQKVYSNSPQLRRQPPSQKFNSPSTFVINTTANGTCPLCQENHSIYKCSVFNSKSPKERYDLVKQNKWCSNCLGLKHLSKNCNSLISCRICNGRHHSLLHFPSNSSPSPLVAAAGNEFRVPESNPQPSTSTCLTHTLTNILPSESTVLLATAQVDILDARGNFQVVRVLLDSASQANFITERCVNQLGLPRSRAGLSIYGIGQVSVGASSQVTCTIKPRDLPEPSYPLEALVLPKLCPQMPTSILPKENWPHIAALRLADPNFNIPGPIDMLLGADLFPLIMKNKHSLGKVNGPSAIDTQLGYILMGKVTCHPMPSISSFVCSLETSIDSTLKRFWELEEVPHKTSLSSEDMLCEKIFLETHSRDTAGRFTVSLPFCDDSPPLFSDTRSQALRRFYSLERRLLQNSTLYTEYANFMKDYLLSGHMEIVDRTSITDMTYYIPHHCVVNPNSTTTKLRVVFDAAAKAPQGQSLNDTLLIGPKLQADIFTILLNFRSHTYVFTADIKQMYRQILVANRHRDYQRILWRFSDREPVQDFRLRTVTYGVSAAPYLAIRTLHQLASDEKEDVPQAARILCRDMYVDDLVTGCDSLSEAQSLQSQIISLLQKGGFELRKWSSNHPELLRKIPVSECHPSSLSFDKHESGIKILGLKWNPALDTFAYEVSSSNRSCTKRNILSDLARIFDPLGFLAPVSFFAKHLIQHLWTLGLDWDQSPPSYFVNSWTQYQTELPKLSLINIPRYMSFNSFFNVELHGFSDSSEKGYSAVIYLRFVLPDEQVKTSLVCAKSKVAPLKRISIPRLELCAAVLLADLMSLVLQILSEKFKFHKLYAWTDSMVTLAWIRSSPHRWNTFVSNRVSHIQSKISPNLWHHVVSKDNPADCASRGLLPSELLNHPLWWTGPPWLAASYSTWPAYIIESTPTTTEEEKKTSLPSFVSLDYFDTLLNKYSSLPKIKRIIAYILRFVFNLKNPNSKKLSAFTQKELHDALLVLVKVVQSVSFPDEITKLRNNTPLAKGLRKLNPFIGPNNLLRVGGRLTSSGLSYDQKHPFLLPQKHRFTELLIEDIHRENLHPGLQTVHYLVSQNFWILSSRRAIRHTLSKCHKCFRIKPTPLEPFMGNLPPSRINQVKPFQCVGVDYGGPFYITHRKGKGMKSHKAYICLFVCFATKCVHLELASDLSTDAFLAALRRFISRRGRCAKIFSDCGTNFVGAHRQLAECMKDATELEKIEWSFNPPSAPHFGGLWEAGIKSVKSHLLRVVGNQILTFEEFYTVLVQVEGVLNSRPLCPMSSDPNDLSVLTPGHFLTLEPLTALPDFDLTLLSLNRLTRWQLLQRMHQDFWHRWQNEYLHNLQQRNKWTNDGKTLSPGTLVLIKNENTPPLQWRLGRVEKTHPGTDGISRVATLRVAQGLLQRPFTKLCPLPTQ